MIPNFGIGIRRAECNRFCRVDDAPAADRKHEVNFCVDSLANGVACEIHAGIRFDAADYFQRRKPAFKQRALDFRDKTAFNRTAAAVKQHDATAAVCANFFGNAIFRAAPENYFRRTKIFKALHVFSLRYKNFHHAEILQSRAA